MLRIIFVLALGFFHGQGDISVLEETEGGAGEAESNRWTKSGGACLTGVPSTPRKVVEEGGGRKSVVASLKETSSIKGSQRRWQEASTAVSRDSSKRRNSEATCSTCTANGRPRSCVGPVAKAENDAFNEASKDDDDDDDRDDPFFAPPCRCRWWRRQLRKI